MRQMLKKSIFYKALKRPESDLDSEAMEFFGINNLSNLSKGYNRLSNGRYQKHREQVVGQLFDTPPRYKMQDGWALDHSKSLPHIDRMIDDANAFIDKRLAEGGRISQRKFFRDLREPGDLENLPSLVDFITSDEVLSIAADYLGYAPVLSDMIPPGVRITESNAALDSDPDAPFRYSQLYHLDFHDTPMVYVIVLLRDVTPQSGPFTWLGKSASDRVTAALKYGARGRPFRLTDEQVYSVIDPGEAQPLVYPKGTVLFLDSSRCFHFGSRKAIVPRYQMMYALTSACRTDVAEWFMPRIQYTAERGPSRARRLALDRTCME